MSVARLHRRRKIIRRAEVIIIKVGWKLIISRGCRRQRRRAEASQRASAHRGALCGVIRPTFCSANLSYLTSAALEDKQRRLPAGEKRRRRTPKSRHTQGEYFFIGKWSGDIYFVQVKIYDTRASYFRAPFLDCSCVGTLFEGPSHSWQLWRIWSNLIMLLWQRAKRGLRFLSSAHTHIHISTHFVWDWQESAKLNWNLIIKIPSIKFVQTFT